MLVCGTTPRWWIRDKNTHTKWGTPIPIPKCSLWRRMLSEGEPQRNCFMYVSPFKSLFEWESCQLATEKKKMKIPILRKLPILRRVISTYCNLNLFFFSLDGLNVWETLILMRGRLKRRMDGAFIQRRGSQIGKGAWSHRLLGRLSQLASLVELPRGWVAGKRSLRGGGGGHAAVNDSGLYDWKAKGKRNLKHSFFFFFNL